MNSRISTYLNHYVKFGKGGTYLLRKTKKKTNEIIEFSIKGIKHPLFLRNNTTDILVFNQVFSFMQYQIKEKTYPTFIIDCGANNGFSAVYFANKYPGALIIAVEPEINNFKMLLKNTAAYSNIKCINKGIWNKKANLEIIDYGGGEYSYVTKEVDYENEKTIAAVSINELVNEFNITQIGILKIDIEGSEKEMFEQNYDHWLSKTDILIVELHDRYKYGCSKSFFTALVNYDFTLGHKGDNIICYMQHPKIISA